MTALDAAAVSPPARLTAFTVADHTDRGAQVGVVAKRTYSVRGGRCLVADDQVALVEIPRVTEDKAVLLHDLDIVVNRRETDVIVVGRARPLGKAKKFEVRVRAGALDRRLLALGDRRCWRDPTGALRFTDPEPIEEIDLGWSSAYGGVDFAGLELMGDPIERVKKENGQPYNPRFGSFAYPRNRTGKGFLIDARPEALERCQLPNLEDPYRLLAPERLAIGKPDRWPGAELPAAFGWLSYGTFPRTAMLGLTPLYDSVACRPESFAEVKLGVLQARSVAPTTPLIERLDLGAAQQAPVGMRVADLPPGTAIELQGCHPRFPTWSFALSREVPEIALQIPGQKPVAVIPKIRTLLIEPELDRLSVVWVGEQRDPVPIGPGKQAQIKYGVRWIG